MLSIFCLYGIVEIRFNYYNNIIMAYMLFYYFLNNFYVLIACLGRLNAFYTIISKRIKPYCITYTYVCMFTRIVVSGPTKRVDCFLMFVPRAKCQVTHHIIPNPYYWLLIYIIGKTLQLFFYVSTTVIGVCHLFCVCT